jgi:hypothetical protein
MNAGSSPTTDTPTPSPRLAQWLTWVAALALILVEVSWFVPLYLGLAEVAFSRTLFEATVMFMLVLLMAYGAQYGLTLLHLLPNVQRLLLVGVFFISLILASQFMLPPGGDALLAQLINLRPAAVLIVAATFWLWWPGRILWKSPKRPGAALVFLHPGGAGVGVGGLSRFYQPADRAIFDSIGPDWAGDRVAAGAGGFHRFADRIHSLLYRRVYRCSPDAAAAENPG